MNHRKPEGHPSDEKPIGYKGMTLGGGGTPIIIFPWVRNSGGPEIGAPDPLKGGC